MRLSRVIQLLRDELSDPASSTNLDWSNAELGRIVSDQTLVMVRKQVTIDEAYHDCTFTLLGATATQTSANTWVYYLPHWCGRIGEIRLKQEASDTHKRQVLRERSKFETSGWRYYGRRAIEVMGYATAQDITIVCAKRPARLTLGTLPTQSGMSSTQIRLDSDSSIDALIYPHESVTDSYVNSVIEITGINDVTAQPGGQVRRVTASAHGQVESGAIYTVLTVDQAWDTQPEASDTYEMHPEVDDEHLRLLILLSARAAWARKGNRDEIRATEMELAQEWAEFQRHIQPRGIQAPKIIKDRIYNDYGAPSGLTADDWEGWS